MRRCRAGVVDTEDVVAGDGALVHRHVGERSAAGDVADGPQPLGADDAHPLVGGDRRASGLVETDGAEADAAHVRRSAGGDEHLVGLDRAAVRERHLHATVTVAPR